MNFARRGNFPFIFFLLLQRYQQRRIFLRSVRRETIVHLFSLRLIGSRKKETLVPCVPEYFGRIASKIVISFICSVVCDKVLDSRCLEVREIENYRIYTTHLRSLISSKIEELEDCNNFSLHYFYIFLTRFRTV